MQESERNSESIRRHYEVERELAARLKTSRREDRPALYRTLYDELFSRVPDHPRILRRDNREESRRSVLNQLALLQPHLDGVKTFLEIAPGDCRLAYEVCAYAERVIGADISDQRAGSAPPGNFELILYDGYNIRLRPGTVDLAFSYQFLEHLHPDDIGLHFEMVAGLLKPGGRYLFDTPHRLSGPHDISRHFSHFPEGFHLREWSYREIGQMLGRNGFSTWLPVRSRRVVNSAGLRILHGLAESVIDIFPRAWERVLSKRLFNSVTILATRG
jgi:SAM-dependent methyltransferase